MNADNTPADGAASPAPQQPAIPTKRAGQRFLFIDGLRGLASMAVVLFHLGWHSPLKLGLLHILPAPALWVLEYGTSASPCSSSYPASSSPTRCATRT